MNSLAIAAEILAGEMRVRVAATPRPPLTDPIHFRKQKPMSPQARLLYNRWRKAMVAGAKPCGGCGRPISMNAKACRACAEQAVAA